MHHDCLAIVLWMPGMEGSFCDAKEVKEEETEK